MWPPSKKNNTDSTATTIYTTSIMSNLRRDAKLMKFTGTPVFRLKTLGAPLEGGRLRVIPVLQMLEILEHVASYLAAGLLPFHNADSPIGGTAN